MSKIIYIYTGKDISELFYNLSILESISKKYNFELICIAKINDKEEIKKIKKKINVTFYIIRSWDDIHKIKFKGKIILIKDNILVPIKKIIEVDKNLDNNDIVILREKSIFNIFLDKIVGIKDLPIFYDFRIYHLLENKRKNYIDTELIFNKDIFNLIIFNLYILLKEILIFVEKILKIKVVQDYINFNIGNIIYKFSSLIIVIALSRILDPYFYGNYVTVYNLILLLSSIIDFGTIIVIQKFLSENITNFDKQKKYIKAAFYILILLSTILLFVLFSLKDFFMSNYLSDYEFIHLILIYLSSMLLAISNLFISIFSSYLKFEKYRDYNLFLGLIRISVIIPLSYINKDSGFIFGLFVVFLLINIYNLKYFLSDFKHLKDFIKVEINFNIFKEIFSYSFFVGWPTLLNRTVSSIDIVILRLFSKLENIAFFYNALVILQNIIMLSSLSSIFIPRIARWDNEKIKYNMPKLISASILINFIIVILLFIFGKSIITLLFGEEYSISYDMIKYMLPLIIISSLFIYRDVLWIKGYVKIYSLLIEIPSLLINIILDIILIPILDIRGLIISLYVSNIYRGLSSYVLYKIKIK